MAASLASSKITFATSLPREGDGRPGLAADPVGGGTGVRVHLLTTATFRCTSARPPPAPARRTPLCRGERAAAFAVPRRRRPTSTTWRTRTPAGWIPAPGLHGSRPAAWRPCTTGSSRPGRLRARTSGSGFYPWEGGYFTTIYPQALPYQRAVYVSGDPAAVWAAQYWQDNQKPVGRSVGGAGAVRGGADGIYGLERSPTARGHQHEPGRRGPTSFVTNPVGQPLGQTRWSWTSPRFSDNEPGHLGSGFQPGIFGGKRQGGRQL